MAFREEDKDINRNGAINLPPLPPVEQTPSGGSERVVPVVPGSWGAQRLERRDRATELNNAIQEKALSKTALNDQEPPEARIPGVLPQRAPEGALPIAPAPGAVETVGEAAGAKRATEGALPIASQQETAPPPAGQSGGMETAVRRAAAEAVDKALVAAGGAPNAPMMDAIKQRVQAALAAPSQVMIHRNQPTAIHGITSGGNFFPTRTDSEFQTGVQTFGGGNQLVSPEGIPYGVELPAEKYGGLLNNYRTLQTAHGQAMQLEGLKESGAMDRAALGALFGVEQAKEHTKAAIGSAEKHAGATMGAAQLGLNKAAVDLVVEEAKALSKEMAEFMKGWPSTPAAIDGKPMAEDETFKSLMERISANNKRRAALLQQISGAGGVNMTDPADFGSMLKK